MVGAGGDFSRGDRCGHGFGLQHYGEAELEVDSLEGVGLQTRVA